MQTRSPLRFAAFVALAVVLGVAVWKVGLRTTGEDADAGAGERVALTFANDGEAPEVAELGGAGDSAEARAAVASVLRERLNRKHVRSDEAVLMFKDAEAYRRFLARARDAGLSVLGKIDGLYAARVKVGDYDAFVRELSGNHGDYSGVSSNAIVAAPTPPAEDRAARAAVPVGENLLATLGLAPGADVSSWGKGVTIAVLDGGASPDATLGTRLKYLDIGYGINSLAADGAHGMAVASLAAGASPDAQGVAPAADVLSIRVTGADGLSDTFSLAQGIFAAVDAGADAINISLGGYATSPVLGEAVDYALAAGVAIVAASGNDQAARLAYPAAYAGVVSVGAVDALGVQAIFSNSGSTLQLTAPGVSVQTAGLSGTRTMVSGTSASAPVVTGAIAALMSQNPGMTALQAADLLTSHASDGGAAGSDPDYGNGSVNLAWAMNASNPSWSDPAVSSQNYDAKTGLVSIVVQNRGGQAVGGLSLGVSANGVATTQALGVLAAGSSTTVTLPVDSALLAEGGQVVVRSQLVTPAGFVDQNTANNRKSGVIGGTK